MGRIYVRKHHSRDSGKFRSLVLLKTHTDL
jgi:hypothetical protein